MNSIQWQWSVWMIENKAANLVHRVRRNGWYGVVCTTKMFSYIAGSNMCHTTFDYHYLFIFLFTNAYKTPYRSNYIMYRALHAPFRKSVRSTFNTFCQHIPLCLRLQNYLIRIHAESEKSNIFRTQLRFFFFNDCND